MKYLFFVILFLQPHWIHLEKINSQYLIIWNVGQGQWITYLDGYNCTHIDMGGEKYVKNLSNICKASNSVWLTHLDFDHSNFIFNNKNIDCIDSDIQVHLKNKYHSKTTSEKYRKLLDLKRCVLHSDLTKVHSPSIENNFSASTNDFSHVYLLKNKVLIPGDSTLNAEKKWINKSESISSKILILGHHGSKTSTSQELLNRLPHLKMAISSARFFKYGHPHAEVINRLKQKKIPQLSTQNWGTILIKI